MQEATQDKRDRSQHSALHTFSRVLAQVDVVTVGGAACDGGCVCSGVEMRGSQRWWCGGPTSKVTDGP